jgi:hypothetical protein
MPFILDVAPIRDGYSADIGHAMCLGENSAFDRAMADLEVFRGEILKMVRAERTMRAIYQRTDEIIADLGYVNCHYAYPFHVLGHKIGRMPFRRIPMRPVLGFDPRTLLYLSRQLLMARLPLLGRHTSLWNAGSQSDVRPDPGLWAIEPHIGRGDLGVKWEEILVITDSDAYWLDDDLPHVRRWRAQGAGSDRSKGLVA